MRLITPSIAKIKSNAAAIIIQLDSRVRSVGPTSIGRHSAHTPATKVSVTKLEPTILPTAAEGCPRSEANNDTQNSGREVMTATSRTVTTSGETRSQLASIGTRRKTNSVPTHNRAIPKTKNSMERTIMTCLTRKTMPVKIYALV
ncbi:MAG: hypothetical protein BWY90_01352 [Deltaproteobacteria bacterium ADurb.BinA014]|nr:MAG: hypothetical protein BWY90_01352 [Deltaproteobacteria bacterium ADurb.BinA014]